MEIKGKYTTAIVHTDNIEQEAINQINDVVNCRAFEGQTVHFMPDVHASLNSTVGFTTTLGVYVMHEWPMIQISKYCSVTPLSSYYRWPLALVVFLACHYVTVAIKNNYRLRFIFFGDEKWLSGVFRKWL